MPTGSYRTLNEPPRFIDRLLAHPYENTLLLLFAGFGISIFGQAIGDQIVVSPAVHQLLPDVLATFMALLSLVGVALAFVGLHWRGDTVSKGWAYERLGLSFVAAAGVAYAVSVVYIFPASLMSWGFPLAVAFASTLRIVALVVTEKCTRRSTLRARAETAILGDDDD